ncbi:unnamed protein product [Linum tenue]|uniref:Uncharacterized protein n=1 Tax=Linum tenue TaxID=586396 RepID=A0AAV0GZI1_9ROSI|nr:unnamed protein product [Linum tenue]
MHREIVMIPVGSIVYVMCNNKLVGSNVKKARRLEIDFEDIDSENEWICGSDTEEESQAEALGVDGGEEGHHTVEIGPTISIGEDGGDDAIHVDGGDAIRVDGDCGFDNPLDDGDDDDDNDELDANVEGDDLM